MSLKVFHLAFVTISTILSLGTGFWGVWIYRAQGGLGNLAVGIVGFAMVPCLAVYGVKMLEKFKTF